MSISKHLHIPVNDSAYRLLSGRQTVVMAILLLSLVASIFWFPLNTFIIANSIITLLYFSSFLYRMYLIHKIEFYDVMTHVSKEELKTLTNSKLPVYTILLPLYKESKVVSQLVKAIDDLDYPKDKLDVKLIIEKGDQETISALKKIKLPSHFEVFSVDRVHPNTKPRALQQALPHIKGKYCVVYDAEDIPDRDQLKKAVYAFEHKLPKHVAVLQPELNFYNSNNNWISTMFSLEYLTYYTLVKPGLQAIDAPMPLSGGSTHIKTAVLKEIGGWDPYNVTEDCDQGMRIARAGYRAVIFDSMTKEGPNSSIRSWINQRSRWVKGFIMTYFVFMRKPIKFMKKIGLKRFLCFQVELGWNNLLLLINPLYWLLLVTWLLTQAHLIKELFPSFIWYLGLINLFIGNTFFIFTNVYAAHKRNQKHLMKYALTLPFYWILLSFGAWKGTFELVFRPHYWQKTVHHE